MSRIRISKDAPLITLEMCLAQPDVEQKSDHDWFVTCPAHHDDHPTLHVTLQPDGKPTVFCFAGCSFLEIVQGFQGLKPVEKPETNGHANGNGHKNGHTGPLSQTKVLAPTPLEWLSSYTSLSPEFLETQAIDFTRRGEVRFIFPHSRAIKKREVKGQVKGMWEVGEDNAPPLWPELPEELPEVIFITAGETDCLCLRATGVEAFALTKGEMGLPGVHLFKDVGKRGAREVVYTADVDDVGKQSAVRLTNLVEDAGMECKLLDLTPHLNAALGEKDVRALTRRVGVGRLQEILEEEYLKPPDLPGTLVDFIAQAPPEVPWLVMPLIVSGATTLFAGHAKAGKTTFVIKIMLAMHDGGDVLGMPVRQSKVFVWTENSPMVWKAKVHGVAPGIMDHIYPISRFDPRFLGKTFDENVRTVFDLAQRLECGVVILDTLTGLAAIEEENEASQVSAALIPVNKMAQRYQIACVMVHHLGRSGQERGSTVFLSEPDILVRLNGEYGEERTLRVKNNMLITSPEDVVFKMDEQGNYVPAVAGVSDDQMMAVLDVLPVVKTQAISLQDIAEQMGLTWDKDTREQLSMQVSHMEKVGRLRRISQGAGMPALHYRVPQFSVKRS